MMSNEKQLQRDLGQILGLEDTEAKTMAQIIKGCAMSHGLVLGSVGAVGMSNAGAVAVPIVGFVPGWLAGFAAGFAAGTLMCTMAQRGVVIEGLKRSMETSSTPAQSDGQAIAQLKATLRQIEFNNEHASSAT